MSESKRNERAEWTGAVRAYLAAAGFVMGSAQEAEMAEIADETYGRDFEPQEAAFYMAEVLA